MAYLKIIFAILNQWRQKCTPLQIIEPMTEKTCERDNFRWAYFDLFSWRVHLGVDCTRVQQKTLSSILNFFCIASTPGISNLWFFITLRSYKVDLIPLLLTVLLNWLYPVLPMNNWQVGLANSSHDCNIYCYQLNKYSGLWVPALMPNPAKLLNHEFLECLCLLCISL